MNDPSPHSSKAPRQPASAAAHPEAQAAAPLSMRSAVDPWLVGILGSSVFAVLYLAGQAVAQAPLQAIVALVMAFVACSVVLMRGVPCYYVLDEDALLIRGGIESRRIPYAEIHQVEPMWSAMGATAWSARRLKILHSKGSEQISPLHRERFAAALRERLQAHR